MIGSVMNEGARGMQNSQREILKSAQNIANANITENTDAKQSPQTAAPIAPVKESQKSDRGGSIAEPLVELRRQEQLFTASAKIVSVADETLGSLIDVKS